MNQKGKESLLKLYQTEGLYDTCRITGLKSYDIINILNQPLDAQLSNDLLFDMLKSGVLPKKYNDIEFFIGNDGVWYLDKKFDMGGDTYMKVYSMATPFWDGTDGLPFDTTNYTIFDKSNDKKISEGDIELYDFAEASGNFENITELIKWYKNFYLPQVQKFFDKHYNRILKYESEG
jgi:hypothetical protein